MKNKTLKTIEEKSRLYDKALEKIKTLTKDFKDGVVIVCKKDLEDIFPEFAEDEDERIRKEIIAWLKNSEGQTLPMDRFNAAIAWLEKQGEHKSTDEVKPKFKVGDWILIDNPCQIESIDNNGNYIVRYCDAEETHLLSRNFCDSHFHLWTIQDAKDGEVLATSAGAFIYNGNNGGGSCPGSYCGINTLGEFKTGVKHHWTGKKVYPATKEQRYILFQKMKESGYGWDAEKKELKEIEQKPVVWSDLDEISLKETIAIINTWIEYKNKTAYKDIEIGKQSIEWLQSIKGRVQPNPAWSEEDESRITAIYTYLQDYAHLSGCESRTIRINKYCDWLKSLRPPYHCDTCKLKKSLQGWKPSDEQIETLANALNFVKNCGENVFDLRILYEQLKKLREE